MWNEKGTSMLESLLTLMIIIVAISFIPFIFQLQHSLYNQSLELHASQVAYEAVIIAKNTGIFEGEKWIDNVEYAWYFQTDAVCVRFNNLDGVRYKCINGDGEL